MQDGVDPEYQSKIEDIKVEGENLSEKGMKPVYSKQKASLDEIQAIIGKMFVDYDTENGFLKLTREQQNRLTNDMKEKLKEMGIVLAQSEVSTVASILGTVYATTYYMNAWVLDEGIDVALKFDILKPEVIKRAVNTKFKGELFSDRIWKNKTDMMNKLQSSLVDAFKGRISIDKIGTEIKKTFNVQAYESKRLMITETARIQTQATDDIAKSTGIKKQMYSATLDKKTNPKDASFDQKVYNVDDPNKPKIPQHPQCRCVYINIPYDGWSPTQRKDNISKKLISNIDYDTRKRNIGIKY
ncbi:MAG TPA: hypothetical protein DEF42_17080 [Desulfosporosinus sp.]|nr:hypothetical protein [Desulfosporosinus sp.]